MIGRRWFFRSLMFIVACTLPMGIARGEDPSVPLRVPSDFRVTRFAGDELAHDIFTMVIDARGRVIVSGPGYIKALVDSDADGAADQSQLLSQFPKEGAQGLAVDGDDLLVVADQGLWRCENLLSEKTAKTTPKKILSLPTGSEHAAHSIQRDPDGSWYLIAGNFSEGIGSLASTPASSNRPPRAGTLWRFDPSFQQRTCWSFGMRNAYDFAFLPNGTPVSYDSDDERDVVLPFYRPTRILALNPGSDAGWVSRGWKDDELAISMPETIAVCGRGSPTGVATYLHSAWSSEYFGSVIAADWTFGRVWIAKPQSKSHADASASSMGLEQAVLSSIEDPRTNWKASTNWELSKLIEGTGEIGFAPTDLAIAPNGDLLVSAGGRGTAGAIYRVAWIGDESSSWVSDSTTPEQPLEQVLRAPQPYDGWSRAKWISQAKELGPKPFLDELEQLASLSDNSNGSTPDHARIRRVLEVLLNLDTALPASTLASLLRSDDAQVRTAAAWSIGHSRHPSSREELELLRTLLTDTLTKTWPNQAEERTRWEAIGLRAIDVQQIELKLPVPRPDFLIDMDRTTSQTAIWAVARLPEAAKQSLANTQSPIGARATVALGRAFYGPPPVKLDREMLEIAVKLENESRTLLPDSKQYDSAVRVCTALVQQSFGDWRSTFSPQTDPQSSNVFDGYRSLFASQVALKERQLWAKPFIQWQAAAVKKAEWNLADELFRTVAMLQPNEPSIVDSALSMITSESHPTRDLHHLLVICQNDAKPSEQQRDRIAAALLSIPRKISASDIAVDRNWPARLHEVFSRLGKLDSFSESFFVRSDFGQPADMIWVEQLDTSNRIQARKKMLEQSSQWPTESWTAEAIRFLSQDRSPAIRSQLRSLTGRTELLGSILDGLNQPADPQDYELFVANLRSSDSTARTAAWRGLSQLKIQDARSELIGLYYLRRKLSAIAATNSRGASSKPSVPQLDLSLASSIEERLRNSLLLLGIKQISGNWTSWPIKETVIQLAGESTWLEIDGRANSTDWKAIVNRIAGRAGDPSPGAVVFQQARCAACHAGGTALGPALTGVAKRFPREDLFRAIYDPNHDLPDRYRPLQVLTDDGQIIIGLSIYDSVDGVTLATADGQTVRIERDQIAQKRTAEQSLMPEGLLDSLSDQQLADLEAYIKTL